MQHVPLIVVVEPEWPLRSYLQAELQECGYEVTVQPHPREATQFLSRWRLHPTLFLIDLASGNFSSQDVLDLLNRYPNTSLLFLVRPFLTVATPLQERAHRILRRPVSIGDLLEAVSELLSSMNR